jgi:mRNA interferase MazF
MPSESEVFYKKGDIIDAPFPYQTDSETEKYRPVLILAPTLIKGGFISAYITSKSRREGVIPILSTDFKEGSLSNYDSSFIQPSTLYTLDAKLIRKKYGTLKDEKVDEVIQALVDLLQQPPESPAVPKAWERPKKPY